MPKKAAKKRTKKVHYTLTHQHHHESNNFLLIVAGGFIVIVVLLFLVNNPGVLFGNKAVTAPEEVGEVVVEPTMVNIGNNAFVDSPITVTAGDEITFVNNDTVVHTATADDGSFDTGDIAPGESKTITVDTPGAFTYHCNYHPEMVGSVVVE